ncbi:MAG: HD domain-containing protein [Anaerolineales bacterium]|nr:HD domain-containing protein [Anaerolineales bacterium]
MKKNLEILFIEDNSFDVELILYELRRSKIQANYKRVETRIEFLESLKDEIDIILADFTLPQFSALQALDLMKENHLDIPFIVVSGTISEETAVDCIKKGANDYLLKDRLTRLVPAIEQAVQEKALRHEKSRAESDLFESEERYRTLIENSPEAIIVVRDLEILYANSAAANLLREKRPKSILRRSLREYFVSHVDGEIPDWYQKIQDSANPVQVEHKLLCSDGAIIDVETRSAYIPYQGAKAIQVIIRDIGERIRRQREQEIMVAVTQALRSVFSRESIIDVLIQQFVHSLGLSNILFLSYNEDHRYIFDRIGGVWELMDAEIEELFMSEMNVYFYTHSPLIVDTKSSNLFLYFERLHEGFESIILLPLVAVGERIGMLIVAKEAQVNEGDIRLLSTISDIVANALQQANTHDKLEETYIELVLSLARTLDARDTPTSNHSRRVADIVQQVMQEFPISEEEIQNARWGAMLHDIGKIGVPDYILLKPGPLTDEEWKIMQKHPEIGSMIISPVGKLAAVVPIIYSHQEKYDGSGYPEGLKSEEIPLGARVIAVVDAYSAMIENRYYRRGCTHEEAVEELIRCSGTDFDPEVVNAFIRVIESSKDISLDAN